MNAPHNIMNSGCDTATNLLNGSANVGDMAEGLMTALNLQKLPVNDLHRQMVLTLKVALVKKITIYF
jgi:hypothetical protein